MSAREPGECAELREMNDALVQIIRERFPNIPTGVLPEREMGVLEGLSIAQDVLRGIIAAAQSEESNAEHVTGANVELPAPARAGMRGPEWSPVGCFVRANVRRGEVEIDVYSVLTAGRARALAAALLAAAAHIEETNR